MEMERKVMDLVEKRMGELLEQVAQVQSGKFEEITQAIAAINLQNQKNKSVLENGEGSGGSNGRWGEERSDWGRSTRYEFPKFDGDGFEGWVMRAEYFFQVAKVAAIDLKGKALQWHKGFESLHGDMAYASWACYTAGMVARFGANAFEDPLADLRNLKQRGTLQSYMDAFDELYPRAGIREDRALSFFLSGLADELQMPVRMFEPKALAEAYSLAKLQELTVRALEGGKSKGLQGGTQSGNSYYSSSKPLAVTTTNKSVGNSGNWGGNNRDNTPFGGVGASANQTPKEMDEKRAKHECFWCPEKFTPNHKCSMSKSFVIQLIQREEPVEPEEPEDESENCEVEKLDLQLSLHAVWGKDGPQVMRIRGLCQKKALKILVDTGSTHNFLSSKMAKRISCELIHVDSKAVEVANDQILQCKQKCSNLEWEMQGATFQAEVYIINLETYDLILGGEWLSTLGEIRWNFNKLSIEFELEGREVKLQGELWSPKTEQLHCLHVLNQQEADEEERKINQLMPAMESELGICCEISAEEIWPGLNEVLEKLLEHIY